MKRLLFLLAVILTAQLQILAQNFSVGDYYYYVTSETNREVELRGWMKFQVIAEIPSTVTFDSKTYSVTSIGHYAFSGCSGLNSVNIPNSVTTIGESAFCGCSSLTSVTIPKSVTSIGSRAFDNCSGLNSFNVDADNEYYSSEENVLFDKTKTMLLFCVPTKRGAYTIPNSVTSIGDFAFSGCSGLTSVTIPNSVTAIGKYAFDDCSSLTSITIPNSVTVIEEGAFVGCSSLTSITIPNSVTSIGDHAFANCSGLTSVTIPNSVTAIGKYAFDDCSSLTSITIPNSVTVIEEGAFDDCSSLTSITIPNSVIIIGEDAFSGCSSLTAITIPKSVMMIREGALADCESLVSITVEQENPVYDSRDNCNAIIEKASNTLIAGCKNSTIPNSVTSIGRIAFGVCWGLISITIPSSVRVIDDQAFHECYNIKEIYALAETPATIVGSDPWEADPFSYQVYENAVLYVPNTYGAATLYRYADGWKNFKHIVAIDMSGIDTPTITPTLTSPTYYNLQGQRITSPQHGINIIGGKKVVK